MLATEHYKQPMWLGEVQEIANLFFVALFTCELVFKLYALGFHVSNYEAPIQCEWFETLKMN